MPAAPAPASIRAVWPPWRQWWQALRWIAATLAAVVALTLAGSFADYHDVVDRGAHPWLPSRKCTGCFLCGMTRSFCAMSDARWAEAHAWNRAGPFLYAGFWLYLAAALGLSARALLTRRLHPSDRCTKTAPPGSLDERSRHSPPR